MPCIATITALVGLLTLPFGAAVAGPVRQAQDFTFQPNPWITHAACPTSANMKFPVGKTNFGILCGWDTHARKYHWGPFPGVTFEECMKKCAEKKKECTVATYTGTCYLKKSALGKGYVKTGKDDNMTAIKLNHKGKPDDKSEKDDGDGR